MKEPLILRESAPSIFYTFFFYIDRDIHVSVFALNCYYIISRRHTVCTEFDIILSNKNDIFIKNTWTPLINYSLLLKPFFIVFFPCDQLKMVKTNTSNCLLKSDSFCTISVYLLMIPCFVLHPLVRRMQKDDQCPCMFDPVNRVHLFIFPTLLLLWRIFQALCLWVKESVHFHTICIYVWM